MMAQGRGNCAIVALMLLFCMLAFQSEISHAASYAVGDAGGWTFNVINWPNGKIFKAGDTIVFNYNTKFHNVVVVDEAGYKACTASPGDKVYESGNDEIQLTKGPNYFLCSIPTHCDRGMKIAVFAE
ncbi:hypothetical protein RIF29_41840 [Crotalaria pallida]|uniref:Basic blue protein n=1 Tax=Crotalaria pallida TaxID=3830 RepID=A0AAN9EBV2_CROPI